MDSILRKIYEGDMHLEEQMVPTTEEYLMQKAKVQQLEQAFYETLSSQMKDDFIEIVEARIRLTGIEVEEACVNGLHLGGQIALAFTNGEKHVTLEENCGFEP